MYAMYAMCAELRTDCNPHNKLGNTLLTEDGTSRDPCISCRLARMDEDRVNYRPISLLSVSSKVLESCITDSIVEHVHWK